MLRAFKKEFKKCFKEWVLTHKILLKYNLIWNQHLMATIINPKNDNFCERYLWIHIYTYIQQDIKFKYNLLI